MAIFNSLGRNPLANPGFAKSLLTLVAIRAAGELERMRTTDALRKSEEMFHSLFDNSHDALMTLDMTSLMFSSGNPTTLEMFRAGSMQDFISHTPWDYSAERQPDGRLSMEKAKEMIETAYREKSNFFEWTHKWLDGEEFPGDVFLTRIDLDDKQFIQATVRYLTKLKQADEERLKLKRQQHGVTQLLHSLLAEAPLGQCLKSITDAIIQIFDADFCRIWLNKPGDLCGDGCPHAEAREGQPVCAKNINCMHLMASSGRYTRIDGSLHSRVPFGFYKIGRIASGDEQSFLTNDLQNDTRIHDHEWARSLGLVSFVGTQIRIPGGEALGVCALFAEHLISPDEEEMLSGLASTLAFVIQRAMTKEKLHKAMAEAEAANTAKSEFLFDMSHELRTPLNAILGFSRLMRSEKDLSDEHRETLDIINHSGEHLLSLINEVLDMSKIESGHVNVENIPFDLGEMVRFIVNLLHGRAEEANLQLRMDSASAFPRFIRVDDAKMRQVLINLVGNAIKFTHSGDVTLRLTTTAADLPQHLLLAIEVADTGVGISAEDQKRIFEPFVQVSQADSQNGTGLGLSITRKYVAMMGGGSA